MTLFDAVEYLKASGRWYKGMFSFRTERLIKLATYFWHKDKQKELF